MKTKLRITFNAPLVLCFALACAVVTLIRVLGGESVANLLFSTYGAPMSDPLMYLRLFTHVLGHADLGHLVGNMAYILLLGPMLEERYGAKRILGVMAATAFITPLLIWMPRARPPSPMGPRIRPSTMGVTSN